MGWAGGTGPCSLELSLRLPHTAYQLSVYLVGSPRGVVGVAMCTSGVAAVVRGGVVAARWGLPAVVVGAS